MIPLTKSQRKALYGLYKRNEIKIPYKEFRKQVKPYLGGDCVLIFVGHIWVGIEQDGFTHS